MRSALGMFLVLSFCAMAAAQPIPPPDWQIGFGTSVITPFLDLPLAGYYYPRAADGVHDHLQAKALVLDDGRERIVLVACDTISVTRGVTGEARRLIQKRLGIPADHILVSATHSHTGPQFKAEYEQSLGRWIADSVTTADGSRKAARLYVAEEQEPSLPHYRRYLMKDGTVRTNPGFLNPDVVKPVGPIDPRVAVLFAEDETRAPLLTWVNYAMHLDTVGGTMISADYPYYLARLLGDARGRDMLTIFTIGPAGNINHWDVRRPGPQRGLDEARRLGEVIGSAVIKAYTHQIPVRPARVRVASATITLPAVKITPLGLEEAKKIVAVPPPKDVDFTLDRVQAEKVLAVHAHGSSDYTGEVQVLAAGDVAFVGIPGELFVELGLQIQKESPFPHTFVVTLANEDLGYLVTREGYQQGAYEPTSSTLAPGAGEAIADKAVELLRQVKQLR